MENRSIFPIQPDILAHSQNYQEKITEWNPFTRNSAVYFQFSVEKGSKTKFLILADGCIELLFRCSPENPKITFFGKRTKSQFVEFEPGYEYFGFRPFYEAGFNRRYLDYLDLIDQKIPLENIQNYQKLLKAIVSEQTFEERINIFNTLGLADFFWDKSYKYNQVIACSRRICTSQGRVDISVLGPELGYSDRHLRRVYKETFGITPNAYKQIIRFQNSIHLLTDEGSRTHDFAQLSYDSGYYDQSYMINDYKKFTQMTPKKLQKLLAH